MRPGGFARTSSRNLPMISSGSSSSSSNSGGGGSGVSSSSSSSSSSSISQLWDFIETWGFLIDFPPEPQNN